ncbi:acyl-CoA carboxylase subunit beta [Dietzia sp. 179-F 9C3 NHS]|uniref:acyl-CoA carboxylase subunit beta n=1 Tax=Dietzia sp. 179-F 9C3 NHS TaxID=3374295 RepID=UPI00387A5FC3
MSNKTTAEKLADLRVKLEQSQDPGSERAKAKRAAAGGTPPRVRIAELLDAGSFVEMGQLAKAPGNADNPFGDGVVTGRGTIEGRPVCVYAHDNTVFGGSVGEGFGKKVCAIMDLAIKIGCPIIGINDSGGARVQDAVTSLAYYSEIGRRQYPASGLVPQISIMLGKCAGGAVYAPVTTDFVVAVQDQAYMFITGPDVIKKVTGEDITMDELGSALQQAKNGNVNHVAVSEHDAFAYVRQLLSFLPSSASEKPPRINPGLEPERTESDLVLDEIIPDSDNAAYDMHDILVRMFDDGEFIETSGQFAPNIITGFARVDGEAVGVVANQPLHLSGALDIDASEKATRFMLICDAYSIPIVYVVDTPGYLPGVQQEKLGIIHRGAKMGYAVAAASVPKVTFVVRKAYGGAYAVMGSKNLGGDLNFAWPTARIAVMGAEGAVDLLQRRQIEEAGPVEGPKLRQQLIDMYNEFIATPYTAAERGYIDAVIEPSETRLMLRKALAQLKDKTRTESPRKHPIMPM